MTKADQLRKNGKMRSDKRLNKSENLRFRQWLSENIRVCQICGIRAPQDAHHLFYGSYGADKDDTKQIAVCRDCHKWCHDYKEKSQERYEWVAVKNWRLYKNDLM